MYTRASVCECQPQSFCCQYLHVISDQILYFKYGYIMTTNTHTYTGTPYTYIPQICTNMSTTTIQCHIYTDLPQIYKFIPIYQQQIYNKYTYMYRYTIYTPKYDKYTYVYRYATNAHIYTDLQQIYIYVYATHVYTSTNTPYTYRYTTNMHMYTDVQQMHTYILIRSKYIYMYLQQIYMCMQQIYMHMQQIHMCMQQIHICIPLYQQQIDVCISIYSKYKNRSMYAEVSQTADCRLSAPDLRRQSTYCNALQRSATHCNALQRTATHCNCSTLQQKKCRDICGAEMSMSLR